MYSMPFKHMQQSTAKHSYSSSTKW